MDLRFVRSRSLFGEDFACLEASHILVLGVGGVGGACVECLARTGVRKITIVDPDHFEQSNQNRQLGSHRVGVAKVDYFAQKFPDQITPIRQKVDRAWCEAFDFSVYDLVIDAIDDMRAKVALAHRTHEKLIASMGSAKRLDPSQIEITSIWKTAGDALAKKFRYELRQSGFEGDFSVVYSTEAPQCRDLGSFMGVTGSFGLFLCSEAVRRLVK